MDNNKAQALNTGEPERVSNQRKIQELGLHDTTIHRVLSMAYNEEIRYETMLERMVILLAGEKTGLVRALEEAAEQSARPTTFMVPGLEVNDARD